MAYTSFASGYDDFTGKIKYETWLCGELIPRLERQGLTKGRLLDVGCGTGSTFKPMLLRGWEVVGCDASAEMIDVARRKFNDVRLEVLDARELPFLGKFQLVWALNDVMNYLVDDGDLERACRGMAANLASDGLLLFDANTLALCTQIFLRGGEGMEKGGWRWTGVSDRVEAGGTFTAEVSKMSDDGSDLEIHHERHWQGHQVTEALKGAGLNLLAAFGQRDEGEGILLAEPPDEQNYSKTIYIASLAR